MGRRAVDVRPDTASIDFSVQTVGRVWETPYEEAHLVAWDVRGRVIAWRVCRAGCDAEQRRASHRRGRHRRRRDELERARSWRLGDRRDQGVADRLQQD